MELENTSILQDQEDIPSTPEEMSAFLHSEMSRLGLHIDVTEPLLKDIDYLGAGSSGYVSVAVDGLLGRTVAVKSLHENLRHQSDQLERMIREAQAAAQLEHPNIVPVYSLGVSPKRGVFFTMKRLRGDSLRHIITQLAQKNPAYTWEYTLQRRLSIFIRICQGISYAHSKGILHRDLKPENVRIGSFGEVTIIDWGLVREVKSDYDEDLPHPFTSIPLHRADYAPDDINDFENLLDASNPTMDGELSGTPRYMSPEQADAQNSALDPRTDIYSLGVILYELLTCYNPFYDKHSENDIINAVIQGNYPKPRQFVTARDVPEELEAICLKALTRNKDKRYQTVSELLHDIYAHQEGQPVIAYKGNAFTDTKKLIKRNPLKSAILISMVISVISFAAILYTLELRNYHTIVEQVSDILEMTARQQSTLQTKLKDSTWKRKTSGSSYEKLQNEIDNNYNAANLLLSSLTPLSQWREKAVFLHERILINKLRFDIQNQRFTEISKQLELLYKIFADNNYSPELKDVISLAEITLKGDCMITSLETQPTGAKITILPVRENLETARMEQHKPVIIEEDYDILDLPTIGEPGHVNTRTAAVSPLSFVKLPKGNYLFQLEYPGLPPVEVPVLLTHGERRTLSFKIPSAIPNDTVYVHESRAVIGSEKPDEDNTDNLFKEINGFFIGQYEVTFKEYKLFYDSLTNNIDKEQFLPKIVMDINEKYIDAWDGDGNYSSVISPDCPVVGISHKAAAAYCTWYGKQLGRPCRLPSADEWELAARGTDGRLYPWGNQFNTNYTFTIENTSAKSKHGVWAKPGSFPDDISPFKVMDMAGNVREWTSSTFDDGTGFWQIKGASSSTSRRFLPLDLADDTPLLPSDVGFRILLPLIDSDFAITYNDAN